jgi:acyl-coenzyme A synthetase/AMP-(fatty) acid ligase
LSDVIELHSERSFSLVGRSSDMVNIAGKRTSLAFLNLQLNAVPGVLDGVFVIPECDEAMRDGVTRLTALVVAPTLTASRLLEALRERIDSAFLPRPLCFVDALPRNATGKLTHSAVSALIDRIAPGGAAPDSSDAPDASQAQP